MPEALTILKPRSHGGIQLVLLVDVGAHTLQGAEVAKGGAQFGTLKTPAGHEVMSRECERFKRRRSPSESLSQLGKNPTMALIPIGGTVHPAVRIGDWAYSRHLVDGLPFKALERPLPGPFAQKFDPVVGEIRQGEKTRYSMARRT